MEGNLPQYALGDEPPRTKTLNIFKHGTVGNNTYPKIHSKALNTPTITKNIKKQSHPANPLKQHSPTFVPPGTNAEARNGWASNWG